jgi:hypothetical protein
VAASAANARASLQTAQSKLIRRLSYSAVWTISAPDHSRLSPNVTHDLLNATAIRTGSGAANASRDNG